MSFSRMEDENQIKQIASEVSKKVIAALNAKFKGILEKLEEYSEKLEEFKDTLNKTLERISERDYRRENDDFFNA
ncbi:MAG: hypothetical protein PHH77_12875 [Victivallaceae bacterium]|nr:hypothetical protein [Victivallaceae bacterium]